MTALVTDQIGLEQVTQALLSTGVQALLGDQLKSSGFTLVSTSITTGTTQPLSISDATFTGKTAGGSVNGSGAVGVVAGSFASSAAETGTAAGQAGLGAAAAADRPYPVADFPGQSGIFAEIRKSDGDLIALSDLLSTATQPDSGARVIMALSYRSDLGANLKWRAWFYYEASADGFFTPFTPDTSIGNVSLYIPEVWTLNNAPLRAGLNGTMIIGQAAAVLGPNSVGTSNLQTGSVTNPKLGDGSVTLVKMGALPDTMYFTGDDVATKFSLTNVVLAAWYKAVVVYRNGVRIRQVVGAPSGLSQYRTIEEGGVTKVELGAALPTGQDLIVDYLY